MTFSLAIAVATVGGFIALSWEIVWIRVYSFLNESAAESFGYVLGAYLAGLAVGAYAAGRYCDYARERRREHHLHVLGWLLVVANVVGFLVTPAVATYAHRFHGEPVEWTLLIFAVAAAFLGTGLPLIAHFGIVPDDEVGPKLSYLYLGNILGSAAGSLTTGFVLLDVLSLQALSQSLVCVGLIVGGLLTILTAGSRGQRLAIGAILGGLGALVMWSSTFLYDGVYEKLQHKEWYRPGERFAFVEENRSGVVTVDTDGALYSGGSYEGQFNVSPLPEHDHNRVLRAYAIAAFHPDPKDVLIIGLGSGSWAQVLADHRDVDSLTVIEIDPGFLEVIRHYPQVAGVLQNPKVSFVIDDGRRYLQRTDRRFDVIVQNTIVYWRAHATNLLSQEHLELTRRHLKSGGVFYLNTTSSTASQRTGAKVFPFAWRFQNMLIGSDSPIEIDRARWWRKMLDWHVNGERVIGDDADHDRMRTSLDHTRWRGEPAWEDRASILARTLSEPVITDNNMATEWWAFEVYP